MAKKGAWPTQVLEIHLGSITWARASHYRRPGARQHEHRLAGGHCIRREGSGPLAGDKRQGGATAAMEPKIGPRLGQHEVVRRQLGDGWGAVGALLGADGDGLKWRGATTAVG